MMKFNKLTKQQKELWLDCKKTDSCSSYNTILQLEIRGKLKTEKLLKAVSNAFQHFHMFRTYFAEEGDMISQKTNEKNIYRPEYHDFSEEVEFYAEQKSRYIVKDRLNEKIDLAIPPLAKSLLIKISDARYHFAIITHHIISDGESARIILDYIGKYYNDLGKEENLPERFQIYDYILSEPQKDADLSKSMSFWQSEVEAMESGEDFYRKKDLSKKSGGRLYFDISGNHLDLIKAFLKENKVTLFLFLVSLHKSFLYRVFANSDAALTYPTNIRPPGFNNVFGYYVNTVPIFAKLNKGDSFLDVLDKVKGFRKRSKKHTQVTLGEITEHLKNNNVTITDGIFNMSVVPANFSVSGLDLMDLKVESIENEYNEVKTDLSLLYDDSDKDILTMCFEYSESFFNREEIKLFSEYFKLLLDEVLRDPAKDIDYYHFGESTLKGNVKSGDFCSINQLLSEVESKFGDTIALKYSNIEISYKELKHRTEIIAEIIGEKSNSKNSVIAVFTDDPIEQILSIIGILKSGRAYLPIDQETPKNRVGYILDNSKADLIITNTENAGKLKEYSKSLINFDGIDFNQVSNFKPKVISEEDLAYVIYTSGTTGEPKGVKVSHKNLACRIGWFSKIFKLKNGDKALHNFNYTFDASVHEIFLPLIKSSTLILNDSANRFNIHYIRNLIVNNNVRLASFVPSLVSLIASSDSSDIFKNLDYLTCGGEQLSKDLVQAANKVNPKLKFYNLYGPTEATILSTYHECNVSDETIPIGKPIDATSIYILNNSYQHQPVGAVGEIYISGDGITKGYFDQELTKESFKDDIFLNDSTLYKTGDMGKVDSSGSLHYLGRTDQQIKINGRRIDLDEIREKILSFDEMFIQAELLVSNNQIIAFVVLRENITSFESYKSSLGDYLPSYMIPKSFIKLKEIPLSKSGKVDYRKLEILFKENTKHKNSSNLIALPKNDTEQKIRLIWAKILETEENNISTNESFFDLNGDSLDAVGLSLELSEEFNRKVDIAKVFQYTNISQQAKYLGISSNSEVQSDLVSDELKIHRKKPQYKNKDKNKNLQQVRKLRRAI